jgi:hypothetical protein
MKQCGARDRIWKRGPLTAVAVAVLLVCADVTQVVAQRTAEQQLIDRAVKRALLERAVAEPLSGGGQSAAQHQLTVLAEKGDVNGRARFFIPFSVFADGIVTFTGPLSNGKTTFATQKGLGKGASLSAGLKLTIWKRTGPEAQFLPSMEAARKGPPQQAHAGVDSAPPVVNRLLMLDGLRRSPERFYAALVQQSPTIVTTRWSGTLTPGFETQRQVVDYLSETSFEPSTFDRSTKTVTLSGGVSKLRVTTEAGVDALAPLFYIGAAFRAGSVIEVADPRKICRAVATPGASECFEAPVGEPGGGNERSLTAELRWWTPKQGLGVNPRYTYGRTKADGAADAQVVHTFDAPIYFMHQTKDIDVPEVPAGADLVGGVNVGWRNGGPAEGAFVVLFLTRAFGLP